MISKSELARHWKVSRQMVMKYVKQGCPLNSKRAADQWKHNRVLKRAPTSGPSIGKFAVEETEPLEPIGGIKKRGRPIKPKQPHRTGDSLMDALNNAITIQERAFEQAEKAMISESSSTSSLLHVHTKALEARFMAETAYREEMERRGLVVEKAIIVEMTRRTMEPVLRRLRRLPQERGPECNDAPNAIAAVGILQKEVNSIIAIGRKALEAFD
jgi:hypothetical protein